VSSALHKYRRIADGLAAEISSGRFKVGDQIPSERVIAESFGTSRMTARQAIRHLAERGIVEARVGQGTFVGASVIQQQLVTLTGFTEEMKKQGRMAGSLVVEATQRLPEPAVAKALGLSVGCTVWRIARIRLADNEPVAMETTEVTAELTPGLLEQANFACTSLYSTLQTHYGIRPATAEQTLAATLAESSVAVPLNISVGAPVLSLTRLTSDADGRAFEYVRSVYRGDAFVMKAFLNVGGE